MIRTMQAWYDLEFWMVSSMILKTRFYRLVRPVEPKTGHQFRSGKKAKNWPKPGFRGKSGFALSLVLKTMVASIR